VSQPKIPADLRAQLNHFGVNALCYQPVGRFKKDPPRKLPNVPRDDDPWHICLRRNDRVSWADGSQVIQVYGDTLREGIELALSTMQPPGLLAKMATLGEALDELSMTVMVRARP
jgi:hypothetical protein